MLRVRRIPSPPKFSAVYPYACDCFTSDRSLSNRLVHNVIHTAAFTESRKVCAACHPPHSPNVRLDGVRATAPQREIPPCDGPDRRFRPQTSGRLKAFDGHDSHLDRAQKSFVREPLGGAGKYAADVPGPSSLS